MDKIGDKHGRLTIISFVTLTGKKGCLFGCDCGKQITMRLDSAKRKDYPSCGCWGKEIRKKKYADRFDFMPYIGYRFSRLLVTGIDSCTSRKRSISRLVCLCDCGAQTIVRGDQLKSGAAKSCGCIQKEWASSNEHRDSKITHANTTLGTIGSGQTSIYAAWLKIKALCLRDYGVSYERVCKDYDKRWDRFEEFLNDFGQIRNDQTISRVDNQVSWSKENCFINIGKRGTAHQNIKG